MTRDFFVPPEHQLANMRLWNEELEFGISEVDFGKLGVAPVFNKKGLKAVVLVPYLNSIAETAQKLWRIIGQVYHGANWLADENYFNPAKLRLLDGIPFPQERLRWEVIRLDANWHKKTGIAPNECRGLMSAHLGIMAAVAHFPNWVKAQDGEKVPYVWLPGLEIEARSSETWGGVLRLCWYAESRQVRLSAYRDDNFNRDYACPVLR